MAEAAGRGQRFLGPAALLLLFSVCNNSSQLVCQTDIGKLPAPGLSSWAVLGSFSPSPSPFSSVWLPWGPPSSDVPLISSSPSGSPEMCVFLLMGSRCPICGVASVS